MIVAFDVSGNYREGFGTTGLCLMTDEGEVLDLNEIKAENFGSAEEYWNFHLQFLEGFRRQGNLEVVMEGFRLYGHKSKEQTNSQFETPQLIGVVRMWCYQNNVPLKIQYAVEVKNRWTPEILVAKGHLEPGNKFKGKRTSTHKQDALKHALHYFRYGRK